ncbi:MAG TPA: hypothetical protein VKQ07_09470, partial [Jatrophihabitantaceae bacterium]|nr:hypothetical protein [Jatrophihabitantaceae bacterium]
TGNHQRPTAASQASAAAGIGTSRNPGTQPRVYGVAVPCPASKPAVAPTTRSSGNLFTTGVAGVTVCGYRFNGAAIPVSQTYSGPDAQTIVNSLENASRTSGVLHCDAIVANQVQSLAFLAQYTSGQRAVVVVAQLGCTQTVSNGATTRFEWTPPSVLSSLLAKMNVAAK